MRRDLRPFWAKKLHIRFRHWYAEHFLRPACEHLGARHAIMAPWHVSISGPGIRIGECATIIGAPDAKVKIGVWGREPDSGRIDIGDYVLLSPGARLSASDSITLGDSVMLANGAYITDSDWHGVYDRTRRDPAPAPVRVGDNVWLGDHALVLKGVTIGENSIIAARAVVSRDVPPNVIAAGNPARVVRTLDPARGFKTRADYFADPEALERFFDLVERELLGENSFFNWLRALVFPKRKD